MRRTAVIFIALLATVVAGCVSAPSRPTSTEETPAWQTWDWSGRNGSLRFTDVTEAGWISLAYPVAADMSVLVEVNLTWTDEQGAYPTPWFCGLSITPWGRGGFCPAVQYDKAAEVGVRAGPVGIDRTVTGSEARRQDGWGMASVTWSSDEVEERRIVREIYAIGGLAPANFSVRVEWENTTLSTVTGPIDDTFTYRHEDFETSARVRAETPWYHGIPLMSSPRRLVVDSGGTLETRLVEEAPRTRFVFDPPASMAQGTSSNETRASFTRPDGSTVPVAGNDTATESTDQTGQWRFRWTEGDGGSAEAPRLYGVRYTPASFPWQDGTFFEYPRYGDS